MLTQSLVVLASLASTVLGGAVLCGQWDSELEASGTYYLEYAWGIIGYWSRSDTIID